MTQNVKLPLDVRASAGQTARLTNTLPGDVRDGMRLCFRTQRQDMVISINGEAILVAGLWSLSESPLRQLFFRAPSGSNVFAFLLVEILAAFVLMYFNELQKHRYDRLYVSLEACILIQALVNAALNATELVDYYNTLIFSHIWLARGGLDRLEALAADWKGSCSRGISVSCGLSFAVDCADLDALVREADHRMYENKRAFYAKSGNDRRSR